MANLVQLAKHVMVEKLADGDVKLLVALDHDAACTFGLSGEAVAALHAMQSDDLVGYCLNQDCAVQEAVTASQAGRVQVGGEYAWICPNCHARLSPPQFPF